MVLYKVLATINLSLAPVMVIPSIYLLIYGVKLITSIGRKCKAEGYGSGREQGIIWS